MKPFLSLKLISQLVLLGTLASIPGCYCQRSIASLGSKLDTPSNLASKKKKPFFGAAAAELLVDSEAESSDGELVFFEEEKIDNFTVDDCLTITSHDK